MDISSDEQLFKSVYEHFKIITQIPHCSRKTELLKEYILEQVEKVNYKVFVDDHDNILIKSPNQPKITLQAHYDMVCVGNAPELHLIEYLDDNGKKIVKAENSSLGADDGFGLAIILALLEEKYNFEALITSDEEVGLVGAVNLKIPLSTNKIINLDSNSLDTIIIGSAGGTVLKSRLTTQLEQLNTQKSLEKQNLSFISHKELNLINLEFLNFIGGHSGIDIHKNIQSAFDFGFHFLRKVIEESSIFHFVSLNGGEAVNSIPVNFEVSFISNISIEHITELKNHSNLEKSIKFSFEKAKTNQKFISNSIDLFLFFEQLLNEYQGVLEENRKLNIPEISNNIGKISTENNQILVSTYVRGMDNFKLNLMVQNMIRRFKSFDFETRIDSNTPTWKPEETQFTKDVFKIYSSIHENVKLDAVHAGLETAIFKERNPNLEVVSLGANVSHLHSIKETMEIDSLFKLYEIVKTILEKAQ